MILWAGLTSRAARCQSACRCNGSLTTALAPATAAAADSFLSPRRYIPTPWSYHPARSSCKFSGYQQYNQLEQYSYPHYVSPVLLWWGLLYLTVHLQLLLQWSHSCLFIYFFMSYLVSCFFIDHSCKSATLIVEQLLVVLVIYRAACIILVVSLKQPSYSHYFSKSSWC